MVAATLRRLGATVVLACMAAAPVHAADPVGLRILPQATPEHHFGGWRSEGPLIGDAVVPLELGDAIDGATLQLEPADPQARHRVRVQYETSLLLSDEGPHLDLEEWKHCRSGWEDAAPLDGTPHAFVLPVATPEQQACFPDYSQAELERAIAAHPLIGDDPDALQRWIAVSRRPERMAHVAVISTIRVRIEVLRDGRWSEATTVDFKPPLGC